MPRLEQANVMRAEQDAWLLLESLPEIPFVFLDVQSETALRFSLENSSKHCNIADQIKNLDKKRVVVDWRPVKET